MKKLNGWQRIGIITSVLWAVGSFFYVRSDQVKFAREWYQALLKTCYSSTEDRAACLDEAARQHSNLIGSPAQFIDAFGTALVPVILAWILIPLIIKIYNWVREGFSK